MAYIKRQLLWYKGEELITINSGIVSASANKTDESTNNSCEVSISDMSPFYTNGIFTPVEGDVMILYSKLVTSGSDTEFTDDDIMWTGKFIDHTRNKSPDSNILELNLGDWAYDVNNNFHTISYYGLGLTTDQVIVDIVSSKVESTNGDGTIALDFTNVATTRNDGSSFPVIDPAFVDKATHEWLDELSQTTYTNTETEIDDSEEVVTEEMVFDIRGTSVYWYEPIDDEVLTITDESTILDISTSSNNESSVNFLILELGEDFNSEPIFYYYYDETNPSGIQKEQYQTETKLAGLNSDWNNDYHDLRKEYSVSTNTEFIAAVRVKAKAYAQKYFENQKLQELSVTIPMDTTLNIGDTVYINVTELANAKYKITGINHRDGSSEYSTTITATIK